MTLSEVRPSAAALTKRSISYALIGFASAPGMVGLVLFRMLLGGRRGVDPDQFSFHHPAIIAGMACLFVAALLLGPAMILLRMARRDDAAAAAPRPGAEPSGR